VQWVLNNGGITNIENYAWTGNQGSCRNGVKSDVSFKAYQRLPKDETAISSAVHNVGTISVGIAATNDWQFYSAGVYDGNCDPAQMDHGVAIIGYGHDDPSNKDLSAHSTPHHTHQQAGTAADAARTVSLTCAPRLLLLLLQLHREELLGPELGRCRLHLHATIRQQVRHCHRRVLHVALSN
jgi:hypothetical protein